MAQSFQNLVLQETEEIKKIITSLAYTGNDDFNCAISNYLSKPSKLLRPILCCLVQRALYGEISEKVILAAVATELAHNASLLHDDVIDDAKIRRNDFSFNERFGAKSAILAGDWLLAKVMEILNKLNEPKLYELFSEATEKMALGELTQFFSRYDVPSLDEYFLKNCNKTGQLFKIAVVSPLILHNDFESYDKAENFAYKFANAFQIADDISDYFGLCEDKPANKDKENGIYTLPDILVQTCGSANLYEESCKFLRHQVNLTVESLDFVSDNKYKEAVISLCKSLLKDKNV